MKYLISECIWGFFFSNERKEEINNKSLSHTTIETKLGDHSFSIFLYNYKIAFFFANIFAFCSICYGWWSKEKQKFRLQIVSSNIINNYFEEEKTDYCCSWSINWNQENGADTHTAHTYTTMKIFLSIHYMFRYPLW